MIYLASPYSDPNPAVRENRYIVTRVFTLWALEQPLPMFSPSVYGHEFGAQLGYVFEAWQTLNDAMVRACEQVWVLRLDGWDKSRGVAHEIELARSLGKPILYVDPIEVKR
jgi:hypothetical protein